MSILPFLVLLVGWLLPAHAADVILKVKSNVATAEVFLDGKLVGPVPVMTYIPPGAHQLRVVADNYDPFVRRFEVSEGKMVDVTATLLPGNGTVEWVGPAGSRLWVDGQERGALPIRLSGLPPGKHAWVVEAPKFEPSQGELELVAGRNYLVDVSLASSAGVFVVTSNPPGASVLLDGKKVGVTPWRGTDIPAGKHAVEVRLDGYARVFRTVDTTDGSRGEANVTLAQAGAMLSVSTGDPEATLAINGTTVGTGRTILVGPLEKGKAALAVTSGGTTASTSVVLPSSGTVELRLANGELAERPPLTRRWGFWAGLAGGAAVVAGGATAVAVANQPEPLPEGDTQETLP